MRRRKKRKLQNEITPVIDETPLPSRRWKKVRKRKRQKYFEPNIWKGTSCKDSISGPQVCTNREQCY